MNILNCYLMFCGNLKVIKEAKRSLIATQADLSSLKTACRITIAVSMAVAGVFNCVLKCK